MEAVAIVIALIGVAVSLLCAAFVWSRSFYLTQPNNEKPSVLNLAPLIMGKQEKIKPKVPQEKDDQ